MCISWMRRIVLSKVGSDQSPPQFPHFVQNLPCAHVFRYIRLHLAWKKPLNTVLSIPFGLLIAVGEWQVYGVFDLAVCVFATFLAAS
jgi:hypothetical protein